VTKKITSLVELQRHFIAAIIDEVPTVLLESVHDTESGLNARQRMNIYKNNVFATLTDALKKTYASILSLVGEEAFTVVARKYITQYPSISRNLYDFGDKFSLLLESLSATVSLPYLSDMAQLDWMYRQVLHETENTPLDMHALQSISSEKYPALKFNLKSASRLLASRFPLLKMWHLCRGKAEEIVHLDEGGDKLLITRHASLAMTIEKLTEGEFALLSAFKEHLPFEKACVLALQAEPVFNIEAFLQKQVLTGMIAAFSF
jgi:hypothetical protein